jgi:hypothetical protein
MDEWNKLPKWFKIAIYCMELILLAVTIIYFAV